MTRIIGSMRTHVALVFLLFSSQAFCADGIWESWGKANDGDWYLLKNSVEYDKGAASVWMMKNLKSEKTANNGAHYRSIRIQYQYDCSGFSERPIWIKGYGDQMGTGVEVFSDYVGYDSKPTVYSPSDWEASYARFCKRKWEFWK